MMFLYLPELPLSPLRPLGPEAPGILIDSPLSPGKQNKART